MVNEQFKKMLKEDISKTNSKFDEKADTDYYTN